MSWFRNLAETYERCEAIVGVPIERVYTDKKGKETTTTNILLPPYHMAMNTDICVIIDGNGKYLNADPTPLNIPIPCTEDSSSRSSGIAAHSLHEQAGYIILNNKKREAYISLLGNWCNHHPKVEAVYKYVLSNTLISDLQNSGLSVEDKTFIRFSVEIPSDLTPHLWEDKTVSEAWQKFNEQEQTERNLCFVTGVVLPIRNKHPKGINPSTNGAKLISCNDETNFTYKGRFTKPEQANAISAKASHQAHAMLKFLIATQGYKCDSQAIVAWAVDDGKPAVNPFADSMSLYDEAEQADPSIDIGGELGADYAKRFQLALVSKGNAMSLTEYGRRIAVLAVDAATTGRMAVTFYNSLPENEYNKRIGYWHESCCWHFRREGKDCIYAPSADKIIAAAYGEPKGENSNKIKKQARERILNFILNGERIDKSWVYCAVNRVSNPFSYDKQDGGWDKYKWENAINVTCAIVRKYYSKEEEIALELDTGCTERSYLYGRLLAIADRLESHARYLQTGKDDTDKRPTNAVRYMARFSTKPFSTWSQIYQQLSPYLQRLNGAEGYQKQIDEIMSLFSSGDYESDKCLDGRYLMGYSLQRRTYRNNNNEEETENAEQEN